MRQETEQHLTELIARYPVLEVCQKDIVKAYDILIKSIGEGGKILICGNGGSAADAEHIAGELMKGYLLPRNISDDDMHKFEQSAGEDAHILIAKLQEAIPAISLVSQMSLNTAVANDNGADLVFAQQVYGYGNKGDVLIALSTSGNSRNVMLALKTAKVMEVKTIGFAGDNGGAMRQFCDVCICVPAKATYKVQELHQPVYHALCAMLEAELFAA